MLHILYQKETLLFNSMHYIETTPNTMYSMKPNEVTFCYLVSLYT